MERADADATDVAEGAGVSFDDFYSGSWTRPVRLAALLTQDSSAAEEIAQDAFVAVFAAGRSFVSRRGNCIDALRMQRPCITVAQERRDESWPCSIRLGSRRLTSTNSPTWWQHCRSASVPCSCCGITPG
jgi:hypothetical protein